MKFQIYTYILSGDVMESDCENMHIYEINKNKKCNKNKFPSVPLKLISLRTNNLTSCMWENQMPFSTRYCRPIKFIFEKETFSTTKREVDEIEKEINELRHLGYQINLK